MNAGTRLVNYAPSISGAVYRVRNSPPLVFVPSPMIQALPLRSSVSFTYCVVITPKSRSYIQAYRRHSVCNFRITFQATCYFGIQKQTTWASVFFFFFSAGFLLSCSSRINSSRDSYVDVKLFWWKERYCNYSLLLQYVRQEESPMWTELSCAARTCVSLLLRRWLPQCTWSL